MIKKKILEYLTNEYEPSAIIVYGSFANDKNDEFSDFDALLIRDQSSKTHDNRVLDNTELDVFIYPRSYFSDEYDINEILQIHNGSLFLDKDGIGAKLLQEVNSYFSQYENKSMAEKQGDISWCEKMLKRIERRNTEGLYRWHCLLTESLEIYFDLKDERYPGPKKGLDLLSKYDRKGFEIYEEALKFQDIDSLKKWIAYLKNTLDLIR